MLEELVGKKNNWKGEEGDNGSMIFTNSKSNQRIVVTIISAIICNVGHKVTVYAGLQPRNYRFYDEVETEQFIRNYMERNP